MLCSANRFELAAACNEQENGALKTERTWMRAGVADLSQRHGPHCVGGALHGW